MSQERIFKELVTELAKDGVITPSEYAILIEKGKDLGLDKNAIDLLIKLELPSFDSSNLGRTSSTSLKNEYSKSQSYTFKSAITRGGDILAPDVIIIERNTVTYKKRNKFLINVDSITISIDKIASVELDTSIWGTDIIIKTFGTGEIIGKKFTKSDAKEIQRLIRERQNN
ncbi:MAG: hypothetical protein M9916_10090 [Crocinitomicaceae bacterium]|nr:hypothetical protein [Crocinitomicaceae bacterium]